MSIPLKREKIEDLMYGGVAVPRFTQDTPILPDVWIAYAQHPGETQELLLTPYNDPLGREGVSAGVLARVLEVLFEVDRGGSQAQDAPSGRSAGSRPGTECPRIARNQTTVFARLCLEDLARVVMPLSVWWVDRGVGSAMDRLWALGARAAEEAIFEALKDPRTPVLPGRAGGSPEALPREALWMARLVGTLAAAAARPSPPKRRTRGAVEEDWPPTQLLTLSTSSDDAPPPSREALDYCREVAHALVRLYTPEPPTPRALAGWAGSQQVGVPGPPGSERIQAVTTVEEVERLLSGPTGSWREKLLYSVSRNRQASLSISRSRAAVKADAAARLFEVSCRDLVWAIVDSGIDARHPAFRIRRHPELPGVSPPAPAPAAQGRPVGTPADPMDLIPERALSGQSRVVATYDFTVFGDLVGAKLDPGNLPEPVRHRAPWLLDRLQHETYAEIVKDLKGALKSGRELDWGLLGRMLQVPHDESYVPPSVEHGTHVAGILAADWPEGAQAESPDEVYRGICPDIRLYDLRVLDDRGDGDEFNVMAALQFARHLNAHQNLQVINGVNLSLSIRHDVANFACGRTPVCEECERLVGDGIIVVAAAGNDGYLQYMTGRGVPQDMYRSISITDPGNAEGVITVGATHRYEPHTYGVSYFSSRGPTGDGRAKPDLVAPGEKITAPSLGGGYKQLDGTSMAAPHVSGAAALLIARHAELLGQPERVKRILCQSATDLGRERYFQGCGMLDVLRALQSV